LASAKVIDFVTEIAYLGILFKLRDQSIDLAACRDKPETGGYNRHFFIRKRHILSRAKVARILNGRATANAGKKLTLLRPLFERPYHSLNHSAG
jgi:hypothetical protein